MVKIRIRDGVTINVGLQNGGKYNFCDEIFKHYRGSQNGNDLNL